MRVQIRLDRCVGAYHVQHCQLGMVMLCQIEREPRTYGAIGSECGRMDNRANAVARRRQAMWTDRANRHFDPGEKLARRRAQEQPLYSSTPVRANNDSL